MQRDNQQQQAFRRFLHSPIALILLGCLMFFFLYGVIGLVSRNAEALKTKNLALQEEHDLEVQQTSLEADLAKMKSQQGIDAAIREKFPVVKEGEGVVMIVNDQASVAAAGDAASTNWFVSFFKKLFGKK